jgi:hypothetical protein
MIKTKVVLLGLTLISIAKLLQSQSPLFPNSVVSNDIDFILVTDSDSYTGLTFLGRDDREMPGDPNGGELFDTDTYVFEVGFSDGETLEVWCHSSFDDEGKAQEYVDKLGPRLGKLPAFQRNMINHVVIHNGDRTAFAEIEGQFFILYSENMDKRISTNDLEETVFHESVHASYQFMYQDHPDWTNAQAADPTFITNYAQDNPFIEDIAESALFAYAYLTYSGRLSADIESWLEENIPNRIEFFRSFYSVSVPVNELAENPDLRISPNPTNSRFTIHTLDEQSRSKITVMNLSGQVVKSIDSVNQESITIDLSNYPDGLYTVNLPGYRSARILKSNR